MSTALIILNKNEATGIRKSLETINLQKFAKIIAIDGNSVDNSVEIFNSLGIEVVFQKYPGRGSAIRLGLEIINKSYPQIRNVVLFSCDGNEDGKAIDSIVDLLVANDLVIASRMLKQSWNKEDFNKFKPRKWVNNVFSIFGFVLLYSRDLVYISDPLNGLRGFTTDFAAKIDLHSSGYAIEYEMSLKAYLTKSRYIEIPTIEGQRIAGKSKVPPFKTILQLVKILIQVFFLRFKKSRL